MATRTKQDLDRSIKGAQGRIKKLATELKGVIRNRKSVAKMRTGTQLEADKATIARGIISQKEIRVRREIQGNQNELEQFVRLRDKAPSSFKVLKTGGADKTSARELQLFIENDGQLHRQQGEPIHKNLIKKAEKGVFDIAGAAKLYRHFADTGAKKYNVEFGSGSSAGFAFDVPTRNLVANNFATDFAEDNVAIIKRGRRNLLGK